MAVTRSVSLTAYRALSRRAAVPVRAAFEPRPPGALVWLHLGAREDLPALIDLAARLQAQHGALTVLFTLPEEAPHGPDDLPALPHGMIAAMVPDEHPRSVAAFLDHWHPQIGLWVWGGLRPNLIDACAARGLPLHLVSADVAGLDTRRERWLPDLARHLAGCFRSASARSAAAARRLARFGVAPEVITVLPPLRASGQVPACADSDLEALTEHLQGRPVWYAAALAPGEWRDVLDAHLIALRAAHRLLLVLHVRAAEELAEIRALLDAHMIGHATWSAGQSAGESTQILLTDDAGDAALWYNLAAVTFLGQSLAAGHDGQDPFPAAQLGTAIVHGPHIGAHLESYTRLRSAGATRAITDASSLGAAVARLISPEASAAMAHAGWEVVTEGAEVVDSVIELVQESLEPPQDRETPR